MGQYQQWLHYRDVERLRRAQLEELLEELAQLHTREQLLQQLLQPADGQEQSAQEEAPSILQPTNEMLHALAIGLNGHTNHTHHTDTDINPAPATWENGTWEKATAQSAQEDKPMTAISQALFAQSSLPSAEDEYLPDPDSIASPDASQPPLNRYAALPPIPRTPHSEYMLLPEDMGAFIEQHTLTEPRMALPWWLRNAALQNANGPIDQESLRTNRLIQRWIERWGRHPDTQELPGENRENRENEGNEESKQNRESWGNTSL
ncbi:MAG TPA: hypothetical protein VNG51_10340 [Ktedonobacteraceae bacterium]|nr:hypothetical protein [Ktedonobacteraceae bacterium]